MELSFFYFGHLIIQLTAEVRVNNFWEKSSAGIERPKLGAGLSGAAAIVYRKPLS